MSAVINEIDLKARVVWVGYEGVQEELLANLRCYGIQFVPSPYRGRIGIPYLTGKSEVQKFAKAAASIVEIWTLRSGITKRTERDFAAAFMIVRKHQVQDESEEGNQIGDWVRGQAEIVGGVA